MSKPININETLTFIPNGNTGTTNLTASSYYPSSNGNTSHTSDTYVRFTTQTTAGYTYYVFPVSGIPEGASISSVSCIAKIRINNTSRVSNTNIRLYSGTTAKGSSKTFSSTSTSNTVTLNDATWTVSEVNNARLRFGGTKASSDNSGYIYFYGATLSVTYVLQGTEYEITSTLATEAVDSIDPPGQTYVAEGNDYELSIHASSIDDVIVEDNGVDVTNQLVQHQNQSGENTISKTADSFTTGFSGGTSMSFYTSSSSATNNFNYAVGHTAESPGATSSGSGSWTYVKEGSSSTNNTGYADFVFNFSDIPANAIIKSVQIKCYGAVEDNSQTTSHADITLFSGSTQKGTMQKFTSSSNSIITISDPGTWTRTELQSAKLRFAVGYYGGHIFGITWNVTYEVPATTQYYWTYSLTNVQADHTIVISDAIIEIPEEDPQYNYYPITISSINATTEPRRGTTRIVEGTTQTITIYPDDPIVTLVLDNGVDVSSQLQSISGDQPSYTVDTAPGASYGFNLNSNTGYYVSTNGGVSSSASVARVNLSLPVRCLVKFTFINSGEATYDFGVFGKVDTTLSTVGWTASSNSGDTTTDAGLEQLRCNTSAYNSTSTQTLNYEIDAGEHYIDVKYGKDQASDSGNDSLQFKLEIEALESNNSYIYTLNDVSQKHSLIFVFGDVTYWYVNSFGGNCKLYPDGQYVVLNGDSYKLVIVPNETNAAVTLTDNNVDVTSQLEEVTSEVEKDGETITYVNYIYRLSNISATHNLIINCVSGATVYMKVNGNWITISKVYKKIDDRWQEQTDLSNLFDLTKIYINGTN